jgi:hypothetical protein
MDYVELARQKALKYGLDPNLFVRQIQAESSFNPNAVSSAGAIGLGQIMPATAKELGINPEDPDQNLEGAARYMRQQLDTFGDYSLALAAYNAGAGNVKKAGGIPNFTETQNYVSKIMGTGGSAMNANMGTGGLLAASQAIEEEYKKEQADKPLFQRDSFKDMAGDMAIIFNEMRMEPSDNIVKAVNSIKAERTERGARNKTVELMKRAGRDDLAAAADAGVLTAKEAYATMLNDAKEIRQAQAKDNLTAKMREYQLAVQQGYQGSFIDYQQQGGGKPPQVGSIPQGYELVTGTNEKGETTLRYVPIKGGPADTAKQDEAARERTLRTAGVVTGAIDKIQDKLKTTTLPIAGFVGGNLAQVKGTNAYSVKALVDTIKANIGFEALSQMRKESPTGGALGQVSNQEIGFLQATLANLDQGQTAEDFEAQLTQLENIYNQIITKLNAYPEEAKRAAGYIDIDLCNAAGAAQSGGSPNFSTMTDEELDAYIEENS